MFKKMYSFFKKLFLKRKKDLVNEYLDSLTMRFPKYFNNIKMNKK